MRVLTLFRVTSCGFHAKFGPKNAVHSILSLHCAASLSFDSHGEVRSNTSDQQRHGFSRSLGKNDRMKGWIKGDFMAYTPTASEAFAPNALTFSGSELFKRTFEEGMGMVEETATYLDGKGRAESKLLPSKAALAYAGESMRLTTRLMQVASWLLVQRAVAEGEMTTDEAAKEKYRLGAREICRGRRAENADLLPPKLLDLLERSMHLYERVERLDQLLYGKEPPATVGFHAQMNRLQAAFGDAAQ
jgi:regulator of CtrA degradation